MISTEQLAYIGIGSNLNNPVEQAKQALAELSTINQSELLAHSSLYRSDPVGPQDQPDFINAVALLRTRLSPELLLDELQSLEKAHQRVRKQHWGPRTLDLDILLYGNQTIATPRLTVPHQFIGERSFVLYPLAEVNPEIILPDGSKLTDLLVNCPMGTLERLPQPDKGFLTQACKPE
ncbi:2-amino-4-hydroxy-6-hydroxymethyldihydropteridine diphosphokinase [Motiliproteus sp. MSK22-1]|uniref:2-amino-4-hydroxy-6- hydroxymethyldihydropteridine diphosphokinase n=1 Tax=Motiliproteus sp. MSK22-1 TaxID=1897630 RepID=UPI000977F32B|nr:2-amino-4-hydroxy-6-hydroxymethyldihydropteridine diphosphokinase [Motiliproteus sp. MSK22-1]OMH32046.1 2-amino-4-hydroxy-6-hydroxymethyldihydropteridine diphosphokinase [Motiliproteus sp. MSK22-1]